VQEETVTHRIWITIQNQLIVDGTIFSLKAAMGKVFVEIPTSSRRTKLDTLPPLLSLAFKLQIANVKSALHPK
jgi:hypothetical protein